MKTLISAAALLMILAFSFIPGNENNAQLKGAWELKNGNEIQTIVFSDQFYSLAQYNIADKNFVSTRGGSWKVKGKEIIFMEEFNTATKESVGKESAQVFTLDKKSLSLSGSDKKKQNWTRVDAGEPGELAGAWLITGRMNDNEMQKITPGVRRTMKILSGTRFQWIAYNTETKEFFGTGGGTYTTANGKYTEHIEFFSRDNSRVGNSLEFDFSLEEGAWRHKGLSSKGDPIDEVWTKRELLGI